MVKKIITVAVMTLIISASSCKRDSPGALSGVPNPPFEGEIPQDAYVFMGEPGIYGGALVMAQPTEMKTLNVIRASEASSNDILWYHLFRSFVTYRIGDETPDFEADLCKKWDVSPDARQWTFYMRKGVLWSDGQPFTADDVLFTYAVILDDKIDTNTRDVFIEGKDRKGQPIYPKLEKIDDYTVRFVLSKPNGNFLDSIFNLRFIPRHKWEQVWRAGNFREAMKISDDPNTVVSNGPFRLKEYSAGQRVVLERNPYFWKVDKKGQRLPYLDRIIFIIAKDYNTVQAKFQAGEIDIMDRMRAEDYALIKRMESSDITVQEVGISYDTNWIVINQNTETNPNTGKPFVEPWKLRLFRNQKFRQAISYAIDREGLINTVYSGRGVPIYSFVTPGDKFWYSDDVMKYPYDASRARQMLAELGLKDTNGDTFLEDNDGNTLEINISTNTENSQRVGTAAFIAKNLQDIGIKANSTPRTLNVIGTILQSTFDFDAIVLGWQVDVPGPTSAINTLISSGQLHACYPNQKTPSTEWEARIDQLVYEIGAEPDPAQRKRILAEIQRIWSEQLPEINLIAQREAIAYRNKFGNLRPGALSPRVTWNSEEIYISQIPD